MLSSRGWLALSVFNGYGSDFPLNGGTQFPRMHQLVQLISVATEKLYVALIANWPLWIACFCKRALGDSRLSLCHGVEIAVKTAHQLMNMDLCSKQLYEYWCISSSAKGTCYYFYFPSKEQLSEAISYLQPVPASEPKICRYLLAILTDWTKCMRTEFIANPSKR